MKKEVNPSTTKTYYIPGHPDTPVSHEFFVEFMRPYRQKRKQLERDRHYDFHQDCCSAVHRHPAWPAAEGDSIQPGDLGKTAGSCNGLH